MIKITRSVVDVYEGNNPSYEIEVTFNAKEYPYNFLLALEEFVKCINDKKYRDNEYNELRKIHNIGGEDKE